MHSILRVIKDLSELHSQKSIRKFHWNKAEIPSHRTIFIVLSAIGLTSYYYFFVVPKWINCPIFDSSSRKKIEAVDDLKLHLQSNLCRGNIDSAKNQFNFIDKVVRQCAPGVFHILITSSKPTSETEIYPFVYGSGFVIRKDGWAITNAHVVLNKDSFISCKMSDSTIYTAEIVDIDVNIDVALLKLHTDKELTALSLEQPGVVDVGEWVVALGSPLCLSNSVSVGVVSSVNRSARELGLKNYSMSYIQTDALITFGNSGGPLVNIDGKVIGISSLRLTSGISFAIPVEFCIKFLENCKSFNPRRNEGTDKNEEDNITLFGLTTISMNPNLLLDLIQKRIISIPKSIEEGLLIWKVLDGSIAKECGLNPGDIITHIDGIPVKDAKDIYSNRKMKKDNLEFIVIKQSTQKEVNISIPMNKVVSSEW